MVGFLGNYRHSARRGMPALLLLALFLHQPMTAAPAAAGDLAPMPGVGGGTSSTPRPASASEPRPDAAVDAPGWPADEGIAFQCTSATLAALETAMDAYLAEQGIEPGWIIRSEQGGRARVVYTLGTPRGDTDTLGLVGRPLYGIEPVTVKLPADRHQVRRVSTVSQKEILLALLQHGRLTEFSGAACSVDALRDHVGIRQNIVAWTEILDWDWPNGGRAHWNRRYWKRGTPVAGHPLDEALDDAFFHQAKYGIGCYTATKLVVLQGVLDYYRRVRPDPRRLAEVEARVRADGEPLQDIEPGAMWNFEKDFDPGEQGRPGKLLRIRRQVAEGNFVPGDWAYLSNTDPATQDKTGYEGSNALYLGRGRFDDYYNDNDHFYTWRQKLDEVYQWRNGVFSRRRDFAKLEALSEDDFRRLGATPARHGLLNDFRVFPYLFGYETLP